MGRRKKKGARKGSEWSDDSSVGGGIDGGKNSIVPEMPAASRRGQRRLRASRDGADEDDRSGGSGGKAARRRGGKAKGRRRGTETEEHADPSVPGAASESGSGAEDRGAGSSYGGHCRRCGGRGHYGKDCPSRRERVMQSKKCFVCGQRGHTRRECPGVADGGAAQSRKRDGKSNSRRARVKSRESPPPVVSLAVRTAGGAFACEALGGGDGDGDCDGDGDGDSERSVPGSSLSSPPSALEAALPRMCSFIDCSADLGALLRDPLPHAHGNHAHGNHGAHHGNHAAADAAAARDLGAHARAMWPLPDAIGARGVAGALLSPGPEPASADGYAGHEGTAAALWRLAAVVCVFPDPLALSTHASYWRDLVTPAPAEGFGAMGGGAAPRTRIASSFACGPAHVSARGWDPEAELAVLRERLAHPSVVAVGPTGLVASACLGDDGATEQALGVHRAATVAHAALAAELNLPLIVTVVGETHGAHVERAWSTLATWLRELSPAPRRILLSAYAGDDATLASALACQGDTRVYVGFDGGITHRKRSRAQEGALFDCPLDRIVLLSNAPHATPSNPDDPRRGSDPRDCLATAGKISASTSAGCVPVGEIAARAHANAIDLFWPSTSVVVDE